MSINGGRYPLWDPTGRNDLYYVDPDGMMMAVSVTTAPTLRVGTARKLFQTAKPSPGTSSWQYDVSPRDGRFVIVKDVSSPRPAGDVFVVLNWLDEVSRVGRVD